MAGRRKCEAVGRAVQSANAAYAVIVRGANGRLRVERFTDAVAYRERLTALEQSDDGGVSIDEIAGLLDA